MFSATIYYFIESKENLSRWLSKPSSELLYQPSWWISYKHFHTCYFSLAKWPHIQYRLIQQKIPSSQLQRSQSLSYHPLEISDISLLCCSSSIVAMWALQLSFVYSCRDNKLLFPPTSVAISMPEAPTTDQFFYHYHCVTKRRAGAFSSTNQLISSKAQNLKMNESSAEPVDEIHLFQVCH